MPRTHDRRPARARRAAPEPAPRDRAHALLSLQRKAGNAAVAGLLRQDDAGAPRSGPERVTTRFGTFEVYPDTWTGPRLLNAYGASAWPIGRAEFGRLQPLLTAVEGGARNLRVEGGDTFRGTVLRDLAWLATVPLGMELLGEVAGTRHLVAIQSSGGAGSGAFVIGDDAATFPVPDGRGGSRPGPGAACRIAYQEGEWNPNRSEPVQEAWMNRPPAIGLAHELIHAYQITHGTVPPEPAPAATRGPVRIEARTSRAELRTVGLGGNQAEHFTENRFRAAFGLPLRTHYAPSDAVDPHPEPT